MEFSLKIFGKHEEEYIDSKGKIRVRLKDQIPGVYQKFEYSFDPFRVKIESIQEYILFDQEGLPIRCSKVYFSDNSHCLAVNSQDTIWKNWWAHLEKHKIE